MPQIKDYTAQVDQLRPTETGVEALAQEGRRVGAFYNQAGEAIRQSGTDIARATEVRARAVSQEDQTFGNVGKDITTAASQFQDYEAHKEIGQLTPVLAKRMSDLSDKYQDAISPKNADPAHADMAIAQFNEQTLEPAFNDMMDAASSPQAKKFVQDHVNQLREHYYEKQAADKSALAGIAVQNGMAEADNSWANAVYNEPSHLDSLIGSKGKPGLIDTSIGGLVDSNPNLRGVAGQKLKTDMIYQSKVNAVHSAFLGALAKTNDPDGLVKQFTQRYSDYIKPNEATQMVQAARVYRNAGDLDYERNRRIAKDKEDDASKDMRENKYIPDITGNNPTFTRKDILNAKDLTWPDKERLIGVINQDGKANQSKPGVLQSLLTGAFDPDNPTTEEAVYKARAVGDLSEKDFKDALQFTKGMQDAATDTPTYKETIRSTEKLFGTGPLGTERHAQFMLDFQPQYIKLKREGNAAGALDTKNPDSLISKVMKDHMPDEAIKQRDYFIQHGGIDPGNAFGPGTTVTGVNVQEKFTPPKGWEYSPSRKQYRDQAGNIYDQDGKPIRTPTAPVIPMSR